MANEPIEPDKIEYFDPPPSHSQGPVQMRTVVVEDSQGPCCSGCGCLLIGLLVVLLFPGLGSLIGTVILLVAAAWGAALLLRAAGISRFSPAYVYALVPLFLVVANLGSRLLRGYWAYTPLEIIVGTLAIYAFLWVAKLIARRQP